MSVKATAATLLVSLNSAMPAIAQSSTADMIAITEKYVTLCQTGDSNDVIPMLIADGLNKPPRGQVPVKVIGAWEFSVALYNSQLFAAQQRQQGGIETPFACNITASFKTQTEPDISALQSAFVPMMRRQFGEPTFSEPHKAQWCETANGGMSITASSRSDGAGRGGRSASSDIINTFKIGMNIGSNRGFCEAQ